jgi:hypothetical protein
MSRPGMNPLRDRIATELVEADVEMAFNLVDMAEAESGAGDPALASHVIESAEQVLGDIEQRLARLEADARLPFTALVSELRREIDLARQHNSGTDRDSG